MKKALQKIKNSFLTNLPWKIAAFFMAFALWFVIMNVQDPVRNESWTVTLELRNEDALATAGGEGIHLENIEQLRTQSIRFLISGTSRGISAAQQNLRAYIDLSTSDILSAAQSGETLTVNVRTAGYTGPFDIFATTPSTVQLSMDTISTVEMAIEVETEGEEVYGFVLLPDSVRVTPATMPVRGPSSIVNRIDRLVVTANINDATGRVYRPDLNIIALDANNTFIFQSQQLNLGTADVELSILRHGRIQVLQPQYHANPPDGFGIRSINWYPRTLEVAGEEYAIANLAPIMMSPIPEGLIVSFTNDFIIPYDIRPYLPPGVYLIDPARHTINVEVFVEPFVQQDFIIPRDNINIIGLPPGAEVITGEVTLRLSALQSIIGGIGVITPTAVVIGANLEEGYNQIPLAAFGLPAGVSIVSEIPTIVVYLESDSGEDTEGQEEANGQDENENGNGSEEIDEGEDEEEGD